MNPFIDENDRNRKSMMIIGNLNKQLKPSSNNVFQRERKSMNIIVNNNPYEVRMSQKDSQLEIRKSPRTSVNGSLSSSSNHGQIIGKNQLRDNIKPIELNNLQSKNVTIPDDIMSPTFNVRGNKEIYDSSRQVS